VGKRAGADFYGKVDAGKMEDEDGKSETKIATTRAKPFTGEDAKDAEENQNQNLFTAETRKHGGKPKIKGKSFLPQRPQRPQSTRRQGTRRVLNG
jgi:hypothetical protein